MLRKTRVLVLLSWGLAHAQSPVNLSGLVKSTRTGTPIEGATVTLERTSLSTTTSGTGSFQLTGVTGVVRDRDSPRARARAGTGPFVFQQDQAGPVVVRLLDLAGKRTTLLHSGTLAAGTWLVAPSSLPSGVHVLSIEGSGHDRTDRLMLGTGTPGARPALAITATSSMEPAARGEASTTADTLRVSRDGYLTARLPLPSLQQSGLSVLLDDSVATPNLDASTIVPDPSWPCYMPDGIPPPALGTLVFRITLPIGAIRDVGVTRFGRRRQYDLQAGSVSGDRITATTLSGGLDYDLTLSNGSKEIEQIVILRAGTTPILMRNAGVAPTGATSARVVVDFEAPNSSSYAWLNTGKFAAMRLVDTVAKTIRMDVYDIAKVALPTARVQVKDPAGAENQSFDCPTQTGGQGASVLTETVTLGSSISIGASKRGSRNIIPITGGTTAGRVVGKILDGGADYQLGGLDARYTLAPNDGELVIVRNCGPGTLYPVFEARADGPYAFLNKNIYVSSSPGIVGSGVTITFYEKK